MNKKCFSDEQKSILIFEHHMRRYDPNSFNQNNVEPQLRSHLGPYWGQLGLSYLGTAMGLSWPILGLSWAHLKQFGVRLGTILTLIWGHIHIGLA
jgi:hypothetical protein